MPAKSRRATSVQSAVVKKRASPPARARVPEAVKRVPVPHINAIGAAVPDHDIHHAFIDWAEAQIEERRARTLFRRMAERSGIAHRWSIFPPTAEGGSPVAPGGFYAEGSPPTSRRMAVYAEAAPELAIRAIADLPQPIDAESITHLVVASCTGFVAPGIDQIIAARLGLAGSVERTLIGFMGCYAAVAALRTAHHIVRSQPAARVLVVTVEISSIHLRPIVEIEPLLAMLLFGDGAAAALVSAEPKGIAIERLFSATLPDSESLIGWSIGDTGFEMVLAGEVPARLAQAMADPAFRASIAGPEGVEGVRHWAVHAGGRTILDAVEDALGLDAAALAVSRGVLRDFGNMSSTTLMFALARLLAGGEPGPGVAIAFGPGLAAEGFGFRIAR